MRDKKRLKQPWELDLETLSQTAIQGLIDASIGEITDLEPSDEATFSAETGTTINTGSTFDGYTLGQIVRALLDAGILG
jgi:hypothetical protein